MRRLNEKERLLHILISKGMPEKAALVILENLIENGLDISKIDKFNVQKLDKTEAITMLLDENISQAINILGKNTEILGSLSEFDVLPEFLQECRDDAQSKVSSSVGYLSGVMDMLAVMYLIIDVSCEDASKIPPILHKMQTIVTELLRPYEATKSKEYDDGRMKCSINIQ